ncbi:hypothetical protein GGI25_006388 [Coemansia spiralis]|uniref:Uncharacterized protein n=2 Tax=Coemansia TaxID=4863 RepID=A0A9W8KV71_9FUNG|nr:hypothetical protein EDC05_006368 [Coemansia umbellata]KAJ2618653.1 hypothetical protein GGI26_006437 [Coemansia sp. RSA 1358]KAJ2668666.1 hypothetical protein GGI25_006388 [Coemansia spiralis]
MNPSAAKSSSARKQLRLFYDAVCKWEAYQKDFIEDVQVLLQMLLQLNSSHQPIVWHPSISLLFPDLPNRFHSVSLIICEQKLSVIKDTREKMTKCVNSMRNAAHWLIEFAVLTKGYSGNDSNQIDSAFFHGSADKYAELTQAAAKLCANIVDMRASQISEVQSMLESLEGNCDIILPPNAFENDTQVANILMWKELPGIIDAKLLGPNSSSFLTLASFKELLVNTEHITQVTIH